MCVWVATHVCVSDTPLDLQGFDYNPQGYDEWHAQAPNIPSISSESSSAVSDRGEYADNATTGHVYACVGSDSLGCTRPLAIAPLRHCATAALRGRVVISLCCESCLAASTPPQEWVRLGASAEYAWGGIGVPNNQGILTRPFICGGYV